MKSRSERNNRMIDRWRSGDDVSVYTCPKGSCSMNCPCGTGLDFNRCCGPIIEGLKQAESAESLMRARYTAYTRVATHFLRESLHPDHRDEHDAESVHAWAEDSQWHGLEIISSQDGGPGDETGTVEFACEFTHEDELRRHHERARFARHEGVWYFVDGEQVKQQPFVRAEPKRRRNDPCPCGSGKKTKKCCGLS
jgi:SEC-C motif domain protein